MDASISLERTLQPLGRMPEASDLEERLLREFQRRYHHYHVATPALWDVVEWYALMQHHGAPTRLLDWTYSPFVASFFALLEARADTCAVVWCCNATWLRERSLKILGPSGRRLVKTYGEDPFLQDGSEARAELLYRFFGKTAKSFVYPLNSFRLNERLTIQQGSFLAPANVARPFHENLLAMKPKEGDWRLWILGDGPKARLRMLRGLNRMNLTEAVLFPGLDGFSRSLKLHWRLIGR